MTVWSHLPTILKRRHALRTAGIIALCVAFITTLFLGVPARADQNVTQVMNFQGRLLNQSGGLVQDGNYNIQFKIYQDVSNVWTETYINNNSTTGVQVKNGYFSVKLGSNTPFGTSVDWSRDDLFLSMNVAGSAVACTTFGTAPCVADGEMTPMAHIDAAPIAVYAKNAGTLNNLSSDKFVQLAQGVQTDASSNTSSIFINKTATGNLIQLQNTAVDVFTVDNGGNIMMGSNSDHSIGIAGSTGTTPGRSLTVNAGAGGSGEGAYGGDLILQGGAAGGTSENGGSVVINAGAKSGSGISGSISIGSANTSSISLGSISTGTPITLHGNTTVTNSSDSTDAFSVKTSLDYKILTVDTLNGRVAVGGDIGSNTPQLSGYGLQVNGAIRLTGGSDANMTDIYTTPVGSTVNTKISIPLYNPGDYGQILALGLPSTANATSRVMSLFDARTGAHQPTIGVFSPNEDNLIGFSWDGSNTVAAVKSTGNSLALQGNGLNLLTATNNGGAANVGIGNSATSGYALDVTGDINTSTQYRIAGVTTLTNAALTFSAASESSVTSTSGQDLSLNGKSGLNIKTNDVTRARFSGTSNTLYLGGGEISATPASFVVQGTNSSATGVAGASITIQGGNATTGDANGGTLTIDGGAKSGSGSGGTISIGTANSSSITIGNVTTNNTTMMYGNIIMKPVSSSDSTNAFQLQRADGTKMLVADSTNQTITFGNSASGNYTVISTSTGAITKYGTARNTKKITLNAEYTGSVLDPGTGSNNSGTMTSSLDLTNRMNYYKWTTSQATNQNYDVVVQVPLPNDFDGWASSNPLSITTRTSDTTNGTITLEARDSSGSVQCNFVSVTPGSTGTWAANNSACTLSSGTYTAGDYITLRIRMQSPQSGDTRIGNITLSYLSKY